MQSKEQYRNLDKALVVAAETGNTTLVIELLKAGANINAGYPWPNDTALSWAAFHGHAQLVEFFITKKAKLPGALDRAFGNKQIPRKTRLAIAQLLLDAGATFDPHSDYYHHSGALRNFIADWNNELIDAAAKNQVTRLNTIIQDIQNSCIAKCIQIYNRITYVPIKIPGIENARNPNGETPLLVAAKNGHVEMVQALVEVKETINDSREAALLWAAFRGHKEVVKILILNKTSITRKNAEGFTILDLVFLNNTTPVEPKLATAELLINAGAIFIKREKEVLNFLQSCNQADKRVYKILNHFCENFPQNEAAQNYLKRLEKTIHREKVLPILEGLNFLPTDLLRIIQAYDHYDNTSRPEISLAEIENLLPKGVKTTSNNTSYRLGIKSLCTLLALTATITTSLLTTDLLPLAAYWSIIAIEILATLILSTVTGTAFYRAFNAPPKISQ